jgi:hypothetical protein
MLDQLSRANVRTLAAADRQSQIGLTAQWILIASLFLTLLSISTNRASAGEATPSQLRILKDLQYLSSDDLQGRCSGEVGLETAGEYVKEQFKSAGLTLPKNDDDGYLEFSINRRPSMGSPNKVTVSDGKGWSEELRVNQNFMPMSLGGSGEFKGELVFAGYAIDAPDLKYSDFDGVDVKGKIAIVLRKAPRQDQAIGNTPFLDEQGVLIPDHASFKSKIDELNKRGAIGVIFVNEAFSTAKQKARIETEIETIREQMNDAQTNEERKARLQEKIDELTSELNAGKYDDLLRFGYGGASSETTMPVFQMKASVASQLMEKAGIGSLDDVQKAIDESLKPHSAALPGITAEGVLTLKSNEAKANNVIAVLEGEGPLADETIIIGAHYDHVGLGEFGSLSNSKGDIHNGADDNASGSSLLMELARRLGSRQEKLPRRIVFIAFAAEEMGLLGSKAYCEKPLYPAQQTVAMFNFDMVGRISDNRIVAFGTKTSNRWEPMLDTLENKYHMHIVRQSPGRGPSDHQSFYDIGVPVLHFFSGLHGDYHTPADDWQKINVSGIDHLVDMMEDAIISTAKNTERPGYQKTNGSANVFNAAGGYPFLGTIGERNFTGTGYQVQQVIPNSPASHVGMQPGDVIVEVASSKVTTPLEFSDALKKQNNTATITVKVKRGDETIQFSPKLQATPN